MKITSVIYRSVLHKDMCWLIFCVALWHLWRNRSQVSTFASSFRVQVSRCVYSVTLMLMDWMVSFDNYSQINELKSWSRLFSTSYTKYKLNILVSVTKIYPNMQWANSCIHYEFETTCQPSSQRGDLLQRFLDRLHIGYPSCQMIYFGHFMSWAFFYKGASRWWDGHGSWKFSCMPLVCSCKNHGFITPPFQWINALIST